MKVALNVLAAYRGAAGIGRFAANAAGSLIAHSGIDLVLLVREESELVSQPLPRAVTVVTCRPSGPLWEQFQLPGILERYGADLYHSPLFVGPLARVCPQMITVHDVIPERFPGQTPPDFLRLWRRYLGPSLRACDAVLTVSEFSRQDIRDTLELGGRPVHSAHQALAEQFSLEAARQDGARVRQKLGLPESYILYVGSIEPRKNVLTLVDVLAELAPSSGDLSLVLAGRTLFGDYDPIAHAARRNVSGRVSYLGYVEDEDLPGLYGEAEMLMFPSLYEGFGLPIVEAMACGCPVVSADNSSLPEAGGEAALYADARDVEAFKEAALLLLEDGDERERRVELGLKHVRRFTQEAFAQRLVDIYERVQGEGRG